MATTRTCHAAASLAGKVYLLGGRPRNTSGHALPSIQVFNEEQQTWTPLPDMSVGRDGPAVAGFIGHLLPPRSQPHEAALVAQLETTDMSALDFGSDLPIQSVAHGEAPTEIDEEEAASVTAVQEAGFIERLVVSGEPQTTTEPEAVAEEEAVYLLHMNRTSRLMTASLAEGPGLQRCREALSAEGHNFRLLSGTMVFVEPWQYRKVMHALNGV